MEIPMGAASAAIVEAGKGIFPTIARHFKHLLCYGRTPKELEEQVKKMTATRDGIQQRISKAEEAGDVPLPDVEQWLDEFRNVESETNKISEGVGHVCCFNYCCWNLCLGYTLSKKAAKQIVKVERLREDRNFPVVSCRPPAPGVEARFRNDGFQIFAPTERTIEEVLKALKQKENYIIGVYGMGGVGKTSLMKEVAKRAVNDKCFEKVVMVTVSQNSDLEKLPEKIAEGLGLTLQSTFGTATELLGMLKNLLALKSILIILDDVWSRVDFNAVGIPSKADFEVKECKVVITTRKLDVCTVMESNCNIRVDTLSEEESWKLFKLKAGEIVEEPSLVKLARDVVQECKGLPLALVILGSSMRNKKHVYEWEVVLKELRSSNPTHIGDMEKEVFLIIKRSIDDLDFEIRLCFLFCCLFPEDFEINLEYLMYYAVGEGLLKNSDTLMEVEKRMHYFINQLKDSCLLLECYSTKYVKMHDVVRDVAKWTTETIEGFLVKAGIGLTSWNVKMYVKECTRISLMRNRIEVLPEQLMCPKLQTLILCDNPGIVLPHEFFNKMEFLLVLDLSNTRISLLPTSMSCLIHLKTLILGGYCGRDISLIGKLKQLEILCLSSCSSLLSVEVLGNLTRLMYLKLEGFEKLQAVFCYDDEHKREGGVVPTVLLPQLEMLHLEDLPELTSIWEGIVPHGTLLLRNLRQLDVYRCHSLKYIVSPDLAAARAFQQLQDLEIRYCDQLEKIIGSDDDEMEVRVGPPSSSSLSRHAIFPNLQTLTVSLCDRLSSLFSWRQAVHDRPHLQRLTIWRCNAMEEIIRSEEEIRKEEEGEDMRQQQPLFPRLHKLTLDELPLLRSFHQGRSMRCISLPSLQELSVLYCPELKELPIGPESAPNLQEIFVDKESIETLELHDGSIESSESRDPQTSSSDQSRAAPRPDIVDGVANHGVSFKWIGRVSEPTRSSVQ